MGPDADGTFRESPSIFIDAVSGSNLVTGLRQDGPAIPFPNWRIGITSADAKYRANTGQFVTSSNISSNRWTISCPTRHGRQWRPNQVVRPIVGQTFVPCTMRAVGDQFR